jgi:competence protein ComEA
MLKMISFSALIAISSISTSFAAIVHINQANASTFADNLIGIGMVKAKAIVRYRKDNGNFETVDDLTKVKGIGTKTVEKNRANLTVSIVKSNTTESE